MGSNPTLSATTTSSRFPLRQDTPARTLGRLLPVIRDHLGVNISGIHPQVTRPAYQSGASVKRCNGACCRGGTTLSLDERDRILRHRSIVASAMTSAARRNPERWFEKRVRRDPDFTSGMATNTRISAGACVFYRDDGRCALQVAGAGHLGNHWALKPAVCILWPLCVQDGALEIGYARFTRRKECCAPVRGGSRTVAEVMEPDAAGFARMTQPRESRGGGPRRAR